jgi:hypothetical protein
LNQLRFSLQCRRHRLCTEERLEKPAPSGQQWITPAAGVYRLLTIPAHHWGLLPLGLESMTYWLPRAVIVLIAWATTCLLMNIVTSVDPLVFYLAGGVWAFVGLISFSYMYKLRRDESSLRMEELARFQQPAE